MKIKNRNLHKKKFYIKKDPFLKRVKLKNIVFCKDCKEYYEKETSCYCGMSDIPNNELLLLWRKYENKK
jgi:hypothetical protein